MPGTAVRQSGQCDVDHPTSWAHTPAMLRRFIAHQRQPQQLVSLPFRIVGFAAAMYVLLGRSAWDSEQTQVAILIVLFGLGAVFLIDIAWWVSRQYRERRARVI
jgi:hypothetical protein